MTILCKYNETIIKFDLSNFPYDCECIITK